MKMNSRKILLLLVVLVMAIALSGCAEYEMTVELDKDGSAKARVVEFYLEESASEESFVGAPIGWDRYETYSKSGKIHEDREKGKYVGYVHEVEIAEEELNDFMLSNINMLNVESFLYERGTFKSKLELQAENNILKGMVDEQKADILLNLAGRNLDVSFKLVTPYKLDYDNAEYKERVGGDYVYTWDMVKSYQKGENKVVAFVTYKNIPLVITIVVGILLMLAAIVVSRRDKEEAEGITEEYMNNEIDIFLMALELDKKEEKAMLNNGDDSEKVESYFNIDENVEYLESDHHGYKMSLDVWASTIVADSALASVELENVLERDKELLSSKDVDFVVFYSQLSRMKTMVDFVTYMGHMIGKLTDLDIDRKDIYRFNDTYEKELNTFFDLYRKTCEDRDREFWENYSEVAFKIQGLGNTLGILKNYGSYTRVLGEKVEFPSVEEFLAERKKEEQQG